MDPKMKGEIRCCGRVSISCLTCDTHHVVPGHIQLENKYTKLLIERERERDGEREGERGREREREERGLRCLEVLQFWTTSTHLLRGLPPRRF